MSGMYVCVCVALPELVLPKLHQVAWRRYLVDTWLVLSDRGVLEWVGFEKAPDNNDMSCILRRDDEIYRILGDCVLGILGARQERMAWLFVGWPAGTIELLSSSPARRDACVAALRRDWEVYQMLKAIPNPNASLRELCERSTLALLTVEQFVEAFLRAGPPWTLTDGILDMARRQHHRIMATQIVEDAFKR